MFREWAERNRVGIEMVAGSVQRLDEHVVQGDVSCSRPRLYLPL